jgi:hypothetical protein
VDPIFSIQYEAKVLIFDRSTLLDRYHGFSDSRTNRDKIELVRFFGMCLWYVFSALDAHLIQTTYGSEEILFSYKTHT